MFQNILEAEYNRMAKKLENCKSSMEVKSYRNISTDNLDRTIASSNDSNSNISSRSPSPNSRSINSLCLNIDYDGGNRKTRKVCLKNFHLLLNFFYK
jgi:hypothetical protein